MVCLISVRVCVWVCVYEGVCEREREEEREGKSYKTFKFRTYPYREAMYGIQLVHTLTLLRNIRLD